LRNDERDSVAGAGVPASVFGHDDDASAAGDPRPVTPPEWADKLRDIQSITDAALSMLDPRALLDALVERAKEALGADTSAILLLDRRSGQLVATAASGLEEEVRQGVRIPVGRGFAGRIAAQGHPVVLDEVDHTKVINPILLDKGIRSLLGAPLLAEGKVIGVLHVGTLSPRAFTDDDVDLEMAARYVPGTGKVGGDWYDVFPLPSGEVCAVIGDVAGTGLPAAVIMGRIRSSLQSYALQTADPAEVLDRLDAKMRYFEPDALATVLCAVVTPSRGQIRISSAGHLPPIIARPGQPAAVAEVAPNVLIGVSSQRRRQVSTLDFPPGAVLCLYTDGLVERRDQPIDQGIAQLRAAVTTADPEAACAAVMAAMAGYSPHTDDIALLILRHPPGEPADSEPDSSPPADTRTTLEPDVAWSGRHAVVTMPAEMDITNAAGISDQLAAVTGQSPDVITADMTATVFCDTSGIHALTRAHELAAASGSELRLALGGSPAARIIQLLGLNQIVPVYSDVEESLATPRNRPDSRSAPPT
jgi:sigma-B regulation protein RsbU (phosphoserine phosphatase)